MLRIVLATWLACGIGKAASAQEVNTDNLLEDGIFNTDGRYAGDYICREEVAGGLKYDKTTREWSSARFNVSTVPMSVIVRNEGRKIENSEGEDFYHVLYSIKLGRIGDTLEDCVVTDDRGFEEVSFGIVDPTGLTSCSTLGDYTYSFNFKTPRFAFTTAMGYVRPWLHGHESPVVIGGVCSKVN